MKRVVAITMLVAGSLLAQDEPGSRGDLFSDPNYRALLLRRWIDEARAPLKKESVVSEFDLQFNRMAETANRFAEKARSGIVDKQLLEKFYREVHKLEQLKP